MGWLHDMTGMKDWGTGHQELMVRVDYCQVPPPVLRHPSFSVC